MVLNVAVGSIFVLSFWSFAEQRFRQFEQSFAMFFQIRSGCGALGRVEHIPPSLEVRFCCGPVGLLNCVSVFPKRQLDSEADRAEQLFGYLSFGAGRDHRLRPSVRIFVASRATVAAASVSA